MKIAILGAGKTGAYAASVLAHEEHDVTLIDRDAGTLAQAGRESDVATLLSQGLDEALFGELLEAKPDLFFAATGDDSYNLTACALAKNMGLPKTAARIKSPWLLQARGLDLKRLFYVDHFVGAEMAAAQDLLSILIHSADIAFDHFADGAILMRTIQIPSTWTKGDVLIRDLGLPENLIVGLIRRRASILFPHGDDVILGSDEVTLVGDAKIMHTLHEFFHVPQRKIKSVVMVGGSSVALHLTRLLLQQRVAVRIIEKRASRALELADLVPIATVIHRDAKDSALFSEEHIEGADAVVTCTEDDGTNLLIGSMARQLQCPKVIALVNDPVNSSLFEKVGITVALSARVNVANRLLAMLHQDTIHSVGSLSNDTAKIVELKIPASSRCIGIPLAELSAHWPKDFLIAAIVNRGRVMVGRGHSILCPDDTVIAISGPNHLEQLHKLFS